MRSFLRIIVVMSAAIVLASCAGVQPFGTTFIRADGQDVSPDQLSADRSGCSEGSEKLENCMSGKGYALVPDDEVAEKQKEFAVNAEKKKQEQAALAAAEKKKQAASNRKKQAASHRAAAKKKLKTKIAAPAVPVQPASAAAPTAPTSPAPAATSAQSSPWYPANPPPPPPEPQR